MTPTRRFPALRRVGVWGLRVLLVLYFVAALLILAGRYFLMPELAQHKDKVAEHISNAIGLPVQIDGLSARWPGFHPQLEIEGLRILDAAGRPALAFERVEATVGWSSLLHLSPHLYRLHIHQPSIEIRRDAAGEIFVAGLSIQGEESAFPDWLLAQRRVVVQDARIIWHDGLRGAPPFELQDLDIELRNFARRHSFGLTATPPVGTASRLDLRGNLVGSEFRDLAGWRGRLYADLDGADLAAWAPWIDLPLEWTRGRGALKLWLDVANLAPTRLIADVRLTDVAVRLRPDLPFLDLTHLDGRIEARVEGQPGDGFSGALRRFSLATREGIVVPPTDAHLSVDQQPGREGGQFRANGLDLGVLAQLASHLPLPAHLRDPLREFSPRGRFDDLALEWQGNKGVPERWKAQGRFAGLGLAPRGTMPGFGGLSGRIEGDEQAGTIHLAGRDAHIDLPAVFPTPTFLLNALEAELGWRTQGDQGFTLDLPRLSFHNADIRAQATGSYRYTGQGPGEIDLSAKLLEVQGNTVWRYMPLIVNNYTRDWLRKGIIEGRVDNASVRIKGPLADFPFRGGQGGIFQVRGTINEASIAFAPEWPRMSGINGEILFEGERMSIHGHQGTIMGVALSNVLAEIPDLEAATGEKLLVTGQAHGSTQEFLDYIEASPIGRMIDHFTAQMQAQGEGKLDLRLDMPLRRVVDTEVEGRYRFTGNNLRVLPRLPVFAAAQGEIMFTAERLEARNLRARFLGGPVSVNVSTGEGGAVQVDANGRLVAAALRRQPEFADMPVFDHLSGETPWRASVTVKQRGADVLIESTMEGLSSSLPDPFNKSVGMALPLRLTGRIDARGDEWTATLGQNMGARFLISQNVWRGRVGIGTGDWSRTTDPLPERGVTLLVRQPKIDLDVWRALAHAGQAPADEQMGPVWPELAALDLRATEMRLAERVFHDVHVRATRPEDKVWRVGIESREAQGRLTWDQAGAGRIVGRFERVHLPASQHPTPVAEAARADQKEPPAINLRIQSLRLRDMELGATSLEAQHRGGAWRAKLEIENDAAKLAGQGRWHPVGAASGTTLDFTLDIMDAEKLLQRLGMSDAVRRGSGRITGSLGWTGSPYALDIASLSGQMKAQVERGQFKQLEPGVGRLLGVLSLQALPRRITLDFRDIFSEGFAFDSIAGEASVARGVLSTRELQIQGPAARILLSGQADLVRETQDLRVRVQPALGETLASGAMLVNPVAGAALWIAQKALGDPLGQVLAYEYAVTGSWQDPQVKPIAASAQSTESPKANEATSP